MTSDAFCPEERRAVLRFVSRAVLGAAALFTLYGFPYASWGISEAWLRSFLDAYARLVGSVLALLDPTVMVQGNVIVGRVALEIVRSCDAMEAKILFASAVVAFPGSLGRKALVLALGLVALVIANVARIASLYFMLLERQSAFEFFHLELWPLLMVTAAGGFFLAGIKFMRAQPPLDVGASHADSRA